MENCDNSALEFHFFDVCFGFESEIFNQKMPLLEGPILRKIGGAVTKVTKMVTDWRPGPGTVVPRALRLGAGVRGQRPRIDGGEHLQPKSILQGWQV